MSETTELGEHILWLCDRERLSMRQASLQAGLDPTTISQIVRRGKTSRPRPDTLRLIADALGGDFDRMMRLAGHLPPAPNPERLREFDEIAEQLASLPDGPIRDEAMAAIRAIADSARRRARVAQQQQEGEIKKELNL